MARRKTDGELLRKAFDAVYHEVDHIQHLDSNEVKSKLQHATRVNRRALGMSLIAISVAVLVIVGLLATQAIMDAVAWANRPTFAERLNAPYGLESKLPPYLLNAVTVDAEVEALITFNTANITYYPKSERPNPSQLMSVVVQLQSIVPANIGDYTLQWNRTQSGLLAQCLLYTGVEEQGRCGTVHTAEFIEPANFVDNKGNQVSLVMTKFADGEQATATMDSMYDYARQLGRIGNFALTDLLGVDYFYSFTREKTSFTWLNENWVFTVSAGDFDTLDKFMEAFPLYENNPNLSDYAVVQITKDATIAPAPTEVTGEETTDTDDEPSEVGESQ